MKYQFKTLMAALTAIVAISATLVACHDDLEGDTPKYNDGYLHFSFLFDNQGEWKDGATSGTQTRMMAPVEMTLPEGFTTPLYLHCIESNTIETEAVDTTAVTRGARITGEAFSAPDIAHPYKLSTFGLYAVVGGEEVLSVYDDPTNMTDKISSFTEIKRSELTNGDEWQVKNQDLYFADENDMWTADKTGDFYGFAPYPGYDDPNSSSDEEYASCIVVNTDDPSAPSITFKMNRDERYNKDILMAKTTGVTRDQKNQGIKMTFKHVLSALKFKLDDDASDSDGTTNDFKYTPEIGGTEYYLQLKSITVEGILDEGTMEIGTDIWTPESSTGSCTSVLDRTYNDVTGDGQINNDAQCMMVLPQTIESTNDDAKLIITVDLTADAAGTNLIKDNVTFEASLKGLNWEPGHTYTYKISKDNRARSFFLESVNGRTGNDFEFEVNGDVSTGYPSTFNVTSYADFSTDGGITTTRSEFPWHIEYSEDGGSNWKSGLPLGFRVKNSSGDYVGANSAIPGSLTPVTYTIEAPVRIEGSPTVETLSNNNYARYADEDGYYDLSLHGIGFSDDVCGQTTARNTANCYIIKGYGKFKLPLVYGNGMKQGVYNSKAYQYSWSGSGHGVFLDHTGRQINDPWITGQIGHYLTGAEVVWTEKQNVVRESSLKFSDDGDYLCFEIAKGDVQPCNLVLAVRDSEGIAWSWHIWVSADDDFEQGNTVSLTRMVGSTNYTMKVARSDLGWNDPEVKHYKGNMSFIFRVLQNDRLGEYRDHSVSQKDGIISLGGTTIAYQQGRKDPFPFTASEVKDPSKPADEITYQMDTVYNKMGFNSLEYKGRNTIDLSIKNPDRLFNPGSYNWFTESDATYPNYQYYPCWDPEGDGKVGSSTTQEYNYSNHTKTIFDPCPVGFTVPKPGLLTMLQNNAGSWSYNSSIQTVDGDEYVKSPISFISTASGLKFYLSGGMRNQYDNGNKLVFQDFDTYGYVWSTGLFSNGSYGVYGRASSSGFTNMQASSPNRYSFYGFSVRPVVDDTQGEIEAWSSIPVQTFHQGNAWDISLTPNSLNKNYGITDLNSIDVNVNGTTMTLGSIINGTGKNNRKILLRNIRVYFTYKGYTNANTVNELLFGYRTTEDFSITYTIGTKSEKEGEGAYFLVSQIPDHYVFSDGWVTKYSESGSTPVSGWDWANLVVLKHSKVTIASVVADLRVTYTD